MGVTKSGLMARVSMEHEEYGRDWRGVGVLVRAVGEGIEGEDGEA